MKKLLSLLMALALVAGLAACSGGTSSSGAASTAPASTTGGDGSSEAAGSTPSGDTVVYATIVQGIDDYQKAQAQGGVDICAEFGWENLTLNSENDVQKQIDAVQNAISQQVDGMYIHDIDPVALAPIIKRALDAGIFVASSMQVRTELGDEYADHELMYCTYYDHETAGRMLTDGIVEMIGAEGEVLILSGTTGFNNTTLRSKGINGALKEYPNVSVVNEIDCNWDRALALSAVEDAVTANPDIKCIISMGEAMAWGAIEALENLDRTDILIGTFDASRQTMQHVIDGELACCVGCSATNGTQGGARVLKNILEGKDPAADPNINWFESHVYSSNFDFFTKENADLSLCDY